MRRSFGFGCPRCGFSVRGNGARAGWPGSCGRSSSSISSGRIGCDPVEREHVGIRSCSCLPATGCVICDIVASYLPYWDNARVWVPARPLCGFAETFFHYLIDVASGGGSELPKPDEEADGALVVGGKLTLTLDGTEHVLEPGCCSLPSSNNGACSGVPMRDRSELPTVLEFSICLR